jgi:hypothetical protein
VRTRATTIVSGRYSWSVFDPALEDANGSRGVDAVSHVGVTDDVASARLVVDGLAGGLVDSLRPADDVDMVWPSGSAHWGAPSGREAISRRVRSNAGIGRQRSVGPIRSSDAPYDPYAAVPIRACVAIALRESLIALAPDAFHPNGRLAAFFSRQDWQIS